MKTKQIVATGLIAASLTAGCTIIDGIPRQVVEMTPQSGLQNRHPKDPATTTTRILFNNPAPYVMKDSAGRIYAEYPTPTTVRSSATATTMYAPIPDPKTPCDEQHQEPTSEPEGCYVPVPH